MTTVTMPDSLRCYLNDDAVRAAVDHINAQDRNHLPATIGWEDLPSLYRAQLAALQVLADWGVFASNLWNTLFQGHIGPKWKPLKPLQQREHGSGTSLSELHDGDSLWFQRGFTFGESEFWSYLNAAPKLGIHVCYGLELSDGTSWTGADHPDFTVHPDTISSFIWTHGPTLRPQAEAIDLKTLTDAVATATSYLLCQAGEQGPA